MKLHPFYAMRLAEILELYADQNDNLTIQQQSAFYYVAGLIQIEAEEDAREQGISLPDITIDGEFVN